MNGAGEQRLRKVGSPYRADTVGAACSLACGVHCLAIPVMLSLTPATRLIDWFSNPIIHQVAAIVSVGIVLWALWPNWSKYRDMTVVTTAALGVILLLLAAFVLPSTCCGTAGTVNSLFAGVPSLIPLQVFIAPVGGGMLLLAHLFNMQLTRRACCSKC